jgi:hypothetical protein
MNGCPRIKPCKWHRRDVVAERGEPSLQFVPLVLRKSVELDHRDHLADLHRGTAHLPKLIDELADERSGPLALGSGGPLGRPDPVGSPHSCPPQPLPGHQPTDPRGPREPTSGHLFRLGRRIVALRTHPPRLATQITTPGLTSRESG